MHEIQLELFSDPPLPYRQNENKEDALIEAEKWNTGVVVNLSKLAK